jgi:hypothetical protein
MTDDKQTLPIKVAWIGDSAAFRNELYEEAAELVDKHIEMEERLTVRQCLFEPTEDMRQVEAYLRDLRIELEVQDRLARSRLALKLHQIKSSVGGAPKLEGAKEMARIVDEMSDEHVSLSLRLARGETIASRKAPI